VPKFVADSSVSPTGLKWAVDPVADVVTTAGDLIYATAADTVTRLGIGTAGQVLKVNSGATAPEWGAASAAGFVGCSLTKSSGQTISNNTYTAATFDTETFDTDGFHSTSSNTSRITIPSGKAGKYLFVMMMAFTTSGTGERLTALNKNGVNFHKITFQANGISGGYIFDSSSTIVDATAGDYWEMIVYQNSGGNLTLVQGAEYTTFSCYYLGA
jgi:hypothetical protein